MKYATATSRQISHAYHLGIYLTYFLPKNLLRGYLLDLYIQYGSFAALFTHCHWPFIAVIPFF
ncbi:autotransporter outer membrane beta-barrel domain-containing protein [Bacillus cereus]|nr:autotransporter outer membrane beta-barrel domain-containing protein [Bacillus cereus]